MLPGAMYPSGTTPFYSKWESGGILVFRKRSDGTILQAIDAANSRVIIPGKVTQLRQRLTIAQINTPTTVLPAIAGYKYRLVDTFAIAYGGAVGATTTVDILATQTTSVKLVAYAQASLTQSALLRAGASGAAILADGASFVANDVNTAISISKTGASLTVATGVDFNILYVLDAA